MRFKISDYIIFCSLFAHYKMILIYMLNKFFKLCYISNTKFKCCKVYSKTITQAKISFERIAYI